MSNGKIKIAIIEDDIAIVEMYRTKFEHLGYAVETAGDGKTGIALIEDFKPDVVLLDLMMPNVTGFDLLSELRRNPLIAHTKIIVLTNMGDTETATRVYKMTADDFIVKAESTPQQVADRVKALLAKAA